MMCDLTTDEFAGVALSSAARLLDARDAEIERLRRVLQELAADPCTYGLHEGPRERPDPGCPGTSCPAAALSDERTPRLTVVGKSDQ